jgi:protein MAK16
LANSRYATVLEEKGVCYLYLKTAERAHTPKELWEKIKLDASYRKAIEQVDELLEYWPEFIKHKCKQRFTRIRQVLVKKKKMRQEGAEQYEVISRKAEKREKSRLKKSEKSALIDKHIEQELLERLKSGQYEGIFNYPDKNFNKLMDEREVEQEIEEEDFNEEDIDNVFVEDLQGDDEDEEDFRGEANNENDKDSRNTNNTSKNNIKGGKINKFINKKRVRSGKKNIELEEEYENRNYNKQEDLDW